MYVYFALFKILRDTFIKRNDQMRDNFLYYEIPRIVKPTTYRRNYERGNEKGKRVTDRDVHQKKKKKERKTSSMGYVR